MHLVELFVLGEKKGILKRDLKYLHFSDIILENLLYVFLKHDNSYRKEAKNVLYVF